MTDMLMENMPRAIAEVVKSLHSARGIRLRGLGLFEKVTKVGFGIADGIWNWYGYWEKLCR